MNVSVVAPDPAWPAAYLAEEQRIRVVLGHTAEEVHHIGSTAIHGIFAKPIIDILLIVSELRELESRVDRMRELGYESLGEFGIAGRRYFRKTGNRGARTHHVHAFEQGSDGARRHLAFRDFMNSHPAAAQAYSTLKQDLALRFSGDGEAYAAGKEAFVRRHESAALAWFYGLAGGQGNE